MRWWRATGASRWGDARKWLTVRLPVASANLPHLASEWLRFLHPLAGKVAKCVAVDLDNTLWGGIIGEDGMNGIRLGADYPGAAFQELQRALLDLSRRGILLAVCSKNNPADAMEALSDSPRDDTPAPRLCRHADQLERQGAEPAGDCRRAEYRHGRHRLSRRQSGGAAAGREQAPEAIVIRLPEDPMEYAQAVRDCPWFERLTLSEEDRQRGDYYAAQRERAELEQKRDLEGGFLPFPGTGGGDRAGEPADAGPGRATHSEDQPVQPDDAALLRSADRRDGRLPRLPGVDPAGQGQVCR